jgi:hypothetical protein
MKMILKMMIKRRNIDKKRKKRKRNKKKMKTIRN